MKMAKKRTKKPLACDDEPLTDEEMHIIRQYQYLERTKAERKARAEADEDRS